jgi:hypothetical protein
MKFRYHKLIFIVAAVLLTEAWSAEAQVSQETLDSLSTPDKVETRIGTLGFKDGTPSVETAKKVYDALDFTRALNVYNNSFRGASALAIKKGLQSIGLQSGDVAITSKLLDADSLFLTANADTVYYMAWIDLSDGPVVIEQPPEGLGTINDMWFSWVIDAGNNVLYAMRSFLVDGKDPKPAVENIKKNLKIYTYEPGSYGTSIAEALTGKVKLGGEPKIPETRFIEISGKSFNTIPPSDYHFFELINENVQDEPATSYDVELAGQLAAIGIVHGKAFKLDARMKKILTDAAAFGSAAGRALNWRYALAHPGWAYYTGSLWGNMLFEGGAFFETPPPAYEGDGKFKPYPPTGARTLDSRAAFYYAYTLDSPGMIMRIPGVGSQYLMGFLDKNGNPFDGAKTYKVTLPKGIPVAAFWSLTLYDNQTRSNAADAAEISARRQSKLPLACGRGSRRRLDHGLFRAGTA